MRFIIYGAGGVGGVIGAQLHKAGTDIALIARGEHLGRLQTEGLRYQTPFVDECLQLPAFGHPEEIEPREDDVVIMTMKSQHTEAALDALRAVRGSNIPVVCCQNSVANERMALRLDDIAIQSERDPAAAVMAHDDVTARELLERAGAARKAARNGWSFSRSTASTARTWVPSMPTSSSRRGPPKDTVRLR